MKALQNVPLRATTDRTGKPVRVDNLDEAKAAMRNMVGSLTEPFKDKPQVAAVVTQMMRGLIEVGPDQAAEAYIDDVPLLAKAQNTGMKLRRHPPFVARARQSARRCRDAEIERRL